MNKILILGHGRHGKDTFADLLREHHGLKFVSSSEAALDVIWPALRCVTPFYDKEEAFKYRDKYRVLWKELISLYNTPDKTALCRLILENNDIYVGMRCRKEYEMTKTMFKKVYWVDATRRVGKDPSMSIEFDPHSMVFINNNGSLHDLELQAKGCLV